MNGNVIRNSSTLPTIVTDPKLAAVIDCTELAVHLGITGLKLPLATAAL